jgi:hypothetical protein
LAVCCIEKETNKKGRQFLPIVLQKTINKEERQTAPPTIALKREWTKRGTAPPNHCLPLLAVPLDLCFTVRKQKQKEIHWMHILLILPAAVVVVVGASS